eukprot:1160938-Pelagomonas_calceolata.AAC.9
MDSTLDLGKKGEKEHILQYRPAVHHWYSITRWTTQIALAGKAGRGRRWQLKKPRIIKPTNRHEHAVPLASPAVGGGMGSAAY